MYKAILEAQESIYWELYIFVDDTAGRPFFDALEQKAKAGINVKIIVDSFGSFWLPRSRVATLKKAGVELLFFYERKKRYRGWWKRIWSRTHRKILVVDEKIGFLGGVNIKKEMKEWLDLHVRVEGKTVHNMLRAFAKSYIICGGEKQKVRHLLKYKFRLLHDEAEVVFDEPSGRRSLVREKYFDALLRARERIILFSPYYFPDKRFLLALWRARKRGVKIDLLIPFRADIRLLTYASYAWFAILRKKYGVNIHLTKQMMHGKGLVVDDEWAMVGSTNIEQTGFYDNYEANIKINDTLVVQKLKQIVEKWIQEAGNFSDEKWKKRGWRQKLKEWLAVRLYRLWHKEK